MNQNNINQNKIKIKSKSDQKFMKKVISRKRALTFDK